MPDADVATAGGWNGTEALRTAYQQADTETMLRVVSEAGELREVLDEAHTQERTHPVRFVNTERARNGSMTGRKVRLAGVAQLVEQLPCKQQVNGSSPFASFGGSSPEN